VRIGAQVGETDRTIRDDHLPQEPTALRVVTGAGDRFGIDAEVHEPLDPLLGVVHPQRREPRPHLLRGPLNPLEDVVEVVLSPSARAHPPAGDRDGRLRHPARITGQLPSAT
jgi:hypothetical protein